MCVHRLDLVELLDDLPRGCGRQQADDPDGQAGQDEGRHQLIDVQQAAHRRDQVLPDKDHHAAHQHAGDCAITVGAPPEQREQDDRAKGGAKARPGEGYDVKDRT